MRENILLMTCKKCGKKFESKYKNRKPKYCSKTCWSVRKPKIDIDCLHCGKTFRDYEGRRKYCDIKCRNNGMLGRKVSEETRQRMSEAKIGYMPVNVFQAGERHPMFKADRSSVNPRWSKEYYVWRAAVFKRDGHACVKCGATRSSDVLLDADHIKPFATNQNKRFDVNNGRVLCRPCHRKEPTWGMKSKRQDFTGQEAKLEQA